LKWILKKYEILTFVWMDRASSSACIFTDKGKRDHMNVISTKNKFGGGCSPFIIRRKFGGHSQSSLLLFKAGFASIRYKLDHIVTILIAHHTSSKTAIVLFNRTRKIEALQEGGNIHLCLGKLRKVGTGNTT
jgi:hypothetical protein